MIKVDLTCDKGRTGGEAGSSGHEAGINCDKDRDHLPIKARLTCDHPVVRRGWRRGLDVDGYGWRRGWGTGGGSF